MSYCISDNRTTNTSGGTCDVEQIPASKNKGDTKETSATVTDQNPSSSSDGNYSLSKIIGDNMFRYNSLLNGSSEGGEEGDSDDMEKVSDVIKNIIGKNRLNPRLQKAASPEHELENKCDTINLPPKGIKSVLHASQSNVKNNKPPTIHCNEE